MSTLPGGTVRVLHVDDDADFADLTASFLEREDDRFAVETVEDSEAALDRLAAASYDCVVSDYDMPGRDGIEFLEAVRETHPDLPFILFTGKGSEEVASEAISAGVTDYLQKEAGTDQYTVLANRIANAVGHRRSRERLERSEQRLREIIDALPHGVYAVTPDGDFLLANEALADFNDTTVAALEDSTIEEHLPEPAADNLRSHVDSVLQTDEPLRLSSREVSERTGETHVFETRLLPFDVTDIDSRAVLGIAVDVTERERRERRLREEQRRYRAIFNDPNILVALLETDGTVRDVNETAIGYVDATRDEVVGRPFAETPWFDDPVGDDLAIERWVEQAARGEYVEYELELHGPDDEPYAVEGVMRPVTDDSGDVVSIVVSAREVTEQRRHARELEQTNALLSTLFDTLPVGVLAEDESREVVAANQQLFDLFDFQGEPADVVGVDCKQLARDVSTQFADPEGFVDRIDELVAGRERVDSEKLALADGRSFARSHRVIEFADGDGHLWMYRDVSDRIDRETQLEHLNQATRELMAADTRTAVAETGVEAAREILSLEANAIHLYDEDEGGLVPAAHTAASLDLIGDPPTFRPGDSIAWRVYERGEATAVDDVHADPDVHNPESPVRSELYVPLGDHGILIAGSAAPSAFDQEHLVIGEILAGNVAAALSQVARTEELSARERELRQQNERLDEFASIVSHDLRNPLNVATGRVRIARDESDSEHLAAASEALERMDVLIDDLLTLARKGDSVTDRSEVDLSSLVEECWRTVETGSATLEVEAEGAVLADRSRLRQLVENLFRNAIEHGSTDWRSDADDPGARDSPGGSGESGEVGVTVTVGDLDSGFFVADDGPGIPADRRERVFEAGYSTAAEGTGFGLSIVEQVADTHGWDVRVAESEDGGTRFEIVDDDADT